MSAASLFADFVAVAIVERPRVVVSAGHDIEAALLGAVGLDLVKPGEGAEAADIDGNEDENKNGNFDHGMSFPNGATLALIY